MFQHLHLHLNERAVLVRDGKPEKALGPGRYTFWKRYEVIRWNTDEIVFTAPTAVLAALLIHWFETVQLAQGQYGIVFRDERAAAFLRPGVHRIWKVDANVALRVHAENEPLPELTDELREVIPAGELLEANVELNQRACCCATVRRSASSRRATTRSGASTTSSCCGTSMTSCSSHRPT
jgi:hypothetical protein